MVHCEVYGHAFYFRLLALSITGVHCEVYGHAFFIEAEGDYETGVGGFGYDLLKQHMKVGYKFEPPCPSKTGPGIEREINE